MKKNIIKIMLDIIMAAILVLLYNSHVISMAFHEIAGLFIFGLFIIHCLFNKKWIIAVTSRFFNKSLTPRVRLGYIIDLMLLVSFLLIISGNFISQVLFNFADSKDSPWRNIHHFFAGIPIILVGMHLGLHWNFVSNMFKKIILLPRKLARTLSIILMLVIITFGSYSIPTSNFKSWLMAPFTLKTKTGVKNETNNSNLHIPKSDENKSGDKKESNYVNSALNENMEEKSSIEKKSPEGSLIVVMSTIITYLSILGVFTALTYYIDRYLTILKKKTGNV